MTQRTTILAILLGTMALVSCRDSPLTPPASQQNAPSPPAAPVPPGPAGNSNAASGAYDLTLAIGAECSGLPEAVRTRHYTAHLDDAGTGRYTVSLGGADFMIGTHCITDASPSLSCSQFRAVEEGDVMAFDLNSGHEWHGGYITERMPSGGWLVLDGTAAGPWGPTRLDASGITRVYYCPLSSSYSFPSACQQLGTPPIRCDAGLRLTFTKK